MYLVDIYDSENYCAAGPNWFTDVAEGPTLQQALEEAKNWIEAVSYTHLTLPTILRV